MQEVNVGIIGFGTVGAGVAECLLKNSKLIAERTGVKPILKRIADLDITTDRGVAVPDGVLTTDAKEILNGEDIDVVVELVGGDTIAKSFVLQALNNGKPVVTANKCLLAKHGEEIFKAAEKSSADIFYEASVAGGIPVIKAVREGLVGNRIEDIVGILNGTCNYILTRMQNEGIDFQTVLDEAQAAGYAEADPSFDVDGWDTAHKTVILASLAYGKWFGMEPVYVEGIRGINLQDIQNAEILGYRIKLLSVIKQVEGNVQMRVHPTLVKEETMIGSVSGVFNAVWVRGDTVGDTMYYGQGAGREATASAVVADIVDVGLNVKSGSHLRVPGFRPHDGYSNIVAIDNVDSRYYLRLQVKDTSGVLAKVSGILSEENISIASVTQQEIDQPTVPLVILTYLAKEGGLKRALKKISQLDTVVQEPVMMRIEDLD